MKRSMLAAAQDRRRPGEWMRVGHLVGLVVFLLAAPTAAQSLEDQLDAIASEVAGAEATPNRSDQTVDSLEQALLAAKASFLPTLNVEELAARANVPKRMGGGKVAGRLLRLADQRSKGIGNLADQAKSLAVPFNEGLVGVRLIADSESDAARLRRDVERRGGTVDATFENVVLAHLPVDGIEPIGSMSGVYFIDAAATFHPLATVGYGRRVSEGVELVNAQALQRAGVTGRGVKVGILDFGFQKYSQLVDEGEVPRAVAARAFNRAGQLEASTVHGTGCAEIVADMAPDAELYLAAVDGQTGQIVAAGEWLANQGVDIINFSGGGHYGPHDGTAVLDRFVDDLVQRHQLLWVNAAGNEGASHWTVIAADDNGNGFVDNVSPRYPDLIAVSGEQMQIMVVWDDWGGNPRLPSANQDIDAYLFAEGPSGLVVVAASREIQRGRGVPAEMVAVRGIPRGRVLYLGLHMKSVRKPVRVHVFVRGGRLAPQVPGHSVGIPATARAALAVAAVDARNDRLEDFSSRGPTDDRRVKPEVSGPDNTESVAYGRGGSPGRFPGTSAAAPHVAGFAALLKQLEPGASASALYARVTEHVTPKGRSAPNAQHGHGRIDAGRVGVPDGSNADEEPDNEREEDPSESDDDFERRLREIIGQSG